MSNIAIVDYGMGNLRSVAQSIIKVSPQSNVVIAKTPEQIRKADRVILPGQGAMPDCMSNLKHSGLLEEVLNAAKNKPLLGICIGEQMLFEESAETHFPGKMTACLGLLPGKVKKFELEGELQPDGSHFKVPHMGWNRVIQQKPHSLWEGIPDTTRFYFVHSYYVVPDNQEHQFAVTEYGSHFTCAVARDNIFATQFHPEKSALYGLRLYQNFTRWNP